MPMIELSRGQLAILIGLADSEIEREEERAVSGETDALRSIDAALRVAYDSGPSPLGALHGQVEALANGKHCQVSMAIDNFTTGTSTVSYGAYIEGEGLSQYCATPEEALERLKSDVHARGIVRRVAQEEAVKS